MRKVFNFSAGPAVLPQEVLREAADEMLDYQGCGMSVMELSHRGKEFGEILENAEKLLRDLLKIPKNYHVLFLQGGATLQFAMVPMNLFGKTGRAHYFHTGLWSKKAIFEAKKFGEVLISASSEDKNFTYLPTVKAQDLQPDGDYIFMVTNNTIYGTCFKNIPDTGNIPLVGDMSSNILSEPIDVQKFGIIFAGAQKNIGPAGLTIVIIREDLVERTEKKIPTYLDYKTHVKNKSLYNTPPCYTVYLAKLVFEWIKEQGGLDAMGRRNHDKAGLLYDYLDASTLFKSPVVKHDRSIMNVTFVTGQPQLDDIFIREAEGAGLKNLKGHRAVGGMRASIYNAMPKEGVETLIRFMETFEKTHT
ncbi:3-phosphoserine/phosphohydroxythreonine transaminase [PVC group bacterium]|nr:3-phosphoserine/phosphohydroxythreonine transaminase [PVC group bacterium]